MRARGAAQWYYVAARVWLTAALASLALPTSSRLGLWLPLHLALAGAVSVAISGAMTTFAAALAAAPSPPTWLTTAQFAGVNAGAAFVAAGYPPGGGGLFKLDTATLSVLSYERDTSVVLRWNAPV